MHQWDANEARSAEMADGGKVIVVIGSIVLPLCKGV